MDERIVIEFLQIPSMHLVDLAIEMANLNWKESLAIELVGRKRYTQEVAAERANVSVDAMQKWYRSAITKLSKAWNGCWWIKELVGQD